MRIAVAGATGTVGSHVVARARARGHEAVPLSRGQGVDVVTGVGLGGALSGCAAIIDATNPPTIDEGEATAFFRRAAANLQREGAERGASHIITLSIVGIDRVPFGYYAAKLAHERAATDGAVPCTVMRATQFHEFPGQMIARGREGDRASLFDIRVQTVAARTVAEALVSIAEGTPQRRASDLAGPEVSDLVELGRAFVAARGSAIEVVADAETVAEMPDGALLPGDGATIAGPTFAEWLSSEDASAVAL